MRWKDPGTLKERNQFSEFYELAPLSFSSRMAAETPHIVADTRCMAAEMPRCHQSQ